MAQLLSVLVVEVFEVAGFNTNRGQKCNCLKASWRSVMVDASKIHSFEQQ